MAMEAMTAANLSTLIPKHWSLRVRLDAARRAFWSLFEGPEGSMRPILVKTDLEKEAGNSILIHTVSRLRQAGVTGENTLTGSEEKYSAGEVEITVDWIRHAIAITKKAKRGLKYDVISTTGSSLSSWLAWTEDSAAFAAFLALTSTLFAGNAAARSELGVDDTFGTAEIDRIKVALQRQGAQPIRVSKTADGQEQPWFGCVISAIDEFHLKGDPTWVQAQREAAGVGPTNPLFTGALGTYNGVLIYTHQGLGGFQGSPLRAEASLASEHNNSVTTITVGSDNKVNYTEYFPATGTLLIESETMTYTGKTAYTFTGVTRGGGGGAATHAAAKLVTLNNLSRQVGFGAEAAARAIAQDAQPIADSSDYNFVTGIGIEKCYGHGVIKDSAGAAPNVVIAEAYAANPND